MQAKTVHNFSRICARTTHANIGRPRATHPNKSGPRQQQHAVRRIMPSDKQAWLTLFKEYIAWYKASVPDDVIEITWQRIMAGGEGNHQGFVAEDETGQAGGHSCTESLQCHRCLLVYWCRLMAERALQCAEQRNRNTASRVMQEMRPYVQLLQCSSGNASLDMHYRTLSRNNSYSMIQASCCCCCCCCLFC